MRLNGWQRLGVVASALWVPVGLVKGGNSYSDWQLIGGYYIDPTVLAICWIALPILFGWLAVYTAIFVTRWVRRGFSA